MRPSSRRALVEAAVELVLEAGYEALTFEALTARTGRTRSGIAYHFPQRELLVTAACEVLAERWDEEIGGHLAVPFAAADALARARAFLVAALDPVNPGLLLLRAGPTVRALRENPWHSVLERWVPAASTGVPAVDAEVAVLRTLAEGCAVRSALEGDGFDAASREALRRIHRV